MLIFIVSFVNAIKQRAAAVSDVIDGARLESRIRKLGKLMVQAYARYELTGCFADRGDADRYRLEMEAAIKQRSAKQVTRLEKVKGLSNA